MYRTSIEIIELRKHIAEDNIRKLRMELTKLYTIIRYLQLLCESEERQKVLPSKQLKTLSK